MSDALLKEISGKLDKLIEVMSKGGAAAPKPNTSTATADATAVKAAKAAEDKKKAEAAAAAKAAADAAAKAAAGKSGPAAGTKAPGGKHTVDQVREIVRKVAAKLGKETAKDVLKDDGNGAENVISLKPEYYDAVYEGCEVVLRGEAAPEETAADPEDDFA